MGPPTVASILTRRYAARRVATWKLAPVLRDGPKAGRLRFEPKGRPLQRAKINNIELEYAVRGTGEPVLLIHGAHLADALRPLMAEPALDAFQTIQYHRRGFAGSSRPPGPPSAEDPADDAVGLLDHLGIDRAHLVGHSYGAMIALSLAAAYPTRVRSLALLEIPAVTGPAGAAFMDGMAQLTQRYANGDATGAVHGFFALLGPDWRAVIDRAVPGAVEQAEKDASTFFDIDLPTGGQWSFGPEQAAAISCPVLSVLGTASGPLFATGRAQLHEWFPQCQDADIAVATHHLSMESPRAVATAIAAFLRNPGR
jgi:pimeloyl-ACP methyl ester carboxylesterase